MKRHVEWLGRLAVVLVWGTSAAWALGGETSAESGDAEPGFVRIFNGQDLDGWDGDPKAWSVRDGAIWGETAKDAGRTWLVWRGGQPGDFELRLRFRFTRGNSGVQVRSKELDDKQWWVRGYQVEVAERGKMGLWHHSISPAKYRSHLATAGQKVRIHPDGSRTVVPAGDAEQIQAAFRENDWNDLTVVARGPKLVQIINGVEFAELIDEDRQHSARSGLVAPGSRLD